MKKLKMFSSAGLLFLLVACSTDDTTTDATTNTTSSTQVTAADNIDEAGDYTYDTASANIIAFSGSSVSATGTGVTVSGTTATITEGGTYTVTGTTTNGNLVVNADADAKVFLLLNNASITSTTGAPLNISNAYKAIIYLMPGTTNTLTDGTINEYESALYSLTRLTIFGTGSLTVKGNTDAGIASDGGIIIKDGTFMITSTGSAIKTDKNLVIDGGTYTITTGNDGLHSDTSLTINDGNITITESEEGIEGAVVTMNGGTVHLTSADDGLNAAGDDDSVDKYFYMKGGYLVINASGDGIDSNGSIEMTGGTVIVNGPTANDNASIDYDNSFIISGGYLLAVGSSGMAQAPGASSGQKSVKVTFGSAQAANTIIRIQDANGNQVVTFKPAKTYQSVVLSSSVLATGETYTVYTGGTASGTITDGLYDDATYTPGTLKGTFTVNSAVTNFSAN
jgi:hypothetical protein